MTATESSLTRPPVGLVLEVQARHALESLEIGPRLEGGYENDLWLIHAGGREIVLRVEADQSDVDGLHWEHELLDALSRHVPEVVAPIRDREGGTFFLHEGRGVTLLPFVHGTPADPDRDWREAARLLARLHRAGSRIARRPRPGYSGLTERDWACPPLDAAPAAMRARRSQIEAALRTCRDFVAGLDLAQGPIHGDYYRGNVLVANGRIAGLVDWREAHVDFFAYELANGVWEFCRHKDADDFDRRRAAAFTEAYGKAGGPVPTAFGELLVPLIRCRRVLEVCWALRGRAAPVDWDYQLHNLRAYERLADG